MKTRNARTRYVAEEFSPDGDSHPRKPGRRSRARPCGRAGGTAFALSLLLHDKWMEHVREYEDLF
jgi:hypothetical protein